MAVAIVSELVVTRRKFLETLSSYAGEVSGELRVLSQYHRSSSHEAVDQRLLSHFSDKKQLLLIRPQQQEQTLILREREERRERERENGCCCCY